MWNNISRKWDVIFVGKHNKYSDELRIEIVNKYYNNEGSSRSLGKEYNISYKTIDNWIQKHKKWTTILNIIELQILVEEKKKI